MYYSVFPRPPKLSNCYMYLDEKWGKEERVCRSQVYSDITQLFSDDCRTASRSVGHCVLDAKAVKKHGVCGWLAVTSFSICRTVYRKCM